MLKDLIKQIQIKYTTVNTRNKRKINKTTSS